MAIPCAVLVLASLLFDAAAVGGGWADARGVQGRVVAACHGWHAFGAVRGAVLGGGSTALSRMGLRPGAALQDRVLCALQVFGVLVLFKIAASWTSRSSMLCAC